MRGLLAAGPPEVAVRVADSLEETYRLNAPLAAPVAELFYDGQYRSAVPDRRLTLLRVLTDAKPLVLGEFGIDSLREGEAAKCRMLAWQIELAFRSGLAGAVVFSFTDDWYKDRRQVENWKMGLTTAAREPKESFAVALKSTRALY